MDGASGIIWMVIRQMYDGARKRKAALASTVFPWNQTFRGAFALDDQRCGAVAGQ